MASAGCGAGGAASCDKGTGDPWLVVHVVPGTVGDTNGRVRAALLVTVAVRGEGCGDDDARPGAASTGVSLEGASRARCRRAAMPDDTSLHGASVAGADCSGDDTVSLR